MSDAYIAVVQRNIQLTRALLSLGCCIRCTLRALGVSQPLCYRVSYSEVQAKVFEIIYETKHHMNTHNLNVKNVDTQTTTVKSVTIEQKNSFTNLNKIEDTNTIRNALDNESLVNQPGLKRPQDDNIIDENRNTKKSKLENEESVCTVCLGVLQTAEAKMQDVRNNITAEGYETNGDMTLTLKVSLSAAILVRQALVSAKLSTTANDENVRRWPKALGLFDNVSLKDVVKYIYFPTISEALGGCRESTPGKMGTIQLALEFPYLDTDKECSFLVGLCGLKAPVRVKISRVNRFLNKQNNKDVGGWIPPKPIGWNNMRECLNAMTVEKLTSAAHKSCIPTTPIAPNAAADGPAVAITMATIYIAGRYNKYSKELSQTPWLLNGVLKTPHSVLSRMEPHFLSATKCSSAVFSSSGREDVDVRMLGRGRPFVMECVNPKRQMSSDALCALQRAVNESCTDMRINDVQVVTKEDTLKNREDDSEKRKIYLATVTFAEAQTEESIKALNEAGEFLLQQQTPVRVLHRRPLLTRPRMVYAIHLKLTGPFGGELTLTTQAGTYIKEFCHGDLGRTVPNLSTYLKCDCDISDLDVADVEMDWPPRIERDF